MKKSIFLFFLPIASQAQSFNWAIHADVSYSCDTRDIVTDNQGYIYYTGIMQGTADFDPGPGVQNLSSPTVFSTFIAKYDSLGNYEWAFIFETPGFSGKAEAIWVDPIGDIYFAGGFEGTIDLDAGPGTATYTATGQDGFVAKYSASGAYISSFTFGGSGDQYVAAVSSDPSGNIYLGGVFENTTDFDPGTGTYMVNSMGDADGFVAKYTSTHAIVWAFRIGGYVYDDIRDITTDNAGNTYVAGYFGQTVDFDPGTDTTSYTAQSYGDGFIAKYTSAGTYVWSKVLTGSDSETANIIELDNNGNVLVAGAFITNIDCDPGPAVTQFTCLGGLDSFLGKYDSNGNFIWANPYRGADSQVIYGIAVDGNNDIFITGFIENTCDFNPSTFQYNLNPVGYYDVFVAKYYHTGGFSWAFKLGTASEFAMGKAITTLNNSIVVTGYFGATTDFNPASGTANLTASGIGAFIASYDMGPTSGVSSLERENDFISAFPSPASNVLYVIMPDENETFRFSIMDNMGKIIMEGSTEGIKNGLDISSLSEGTYFLVAELNHGTATRKFVIVR